MSNLLIISSAPAALIGGRPFLDVKFHEGMRLNAELWDGRVGCLLYDQSRAFPFGKSFDSADLPYDLRLAPPGRPVSAADLAGYDVVLCDGDDNKYLGLADAGVARIVFTIENVLQSRLQIIALNRDRNLLKKLYDVCWTLAQEARRRRAFRRAAGLQANGYPAHDAYAGLSRRPMFYLDNRVGRALLATPGEMDARARRLAEGGPLRLLHSGRLERLKGSQDLAPIARRLAAAGVDFELDIFGAGALEAGIRAEIAASGLEGRVRLHGPVDFETELVPFARSEADVYLSCHRQSDPSCTYLESMGCGLPVVGYDNRMWRALQAASESGWNAPLGDWRALADEIVRLSKATTEVARHAARARAFAEDHAFEEEFARRVAHLRQVADAAPD